MVGKDLFVAGERDPIIADGQDTGSSASAPKLWVVEAVQDIGGVRLKGDQVFIVRGTTVSSW